MRRGIAEYVVTCLICQQVKLERQRLAGLLNPLPISEWKWEHMISALKAKRLLQHGAWTYLASIVDINKEPLKLDSVPIVTNFADILRKDLSGIPPTREVDFYIDLLPRTTLLSKAP